ILERGIQIDGLGIKSFVTYESNVLFALRFMIDCDIVGGNLIEVPVGKYKKAVRTMSYCQLEFDCMYPYAPEAGADVMSFENKREVLLAWRDFVHEVDPDIIIGYNICKFDLPYLIEIGKAIKVNEKCPNALSMLGALELKNDDWLKAKVTFHAARKAIDGKDSYYALSLVGIVYGKETGTTLLPPIRDCLENRIEICNL
ncbi:hypothetical protein IFM89_020604, partial [Coptis chinensis]